MASLRDMDYKGKVRGTILSAVSKLGFCQSYLNQIASTKPGMIQLSGRERKHALLKLVGAYMLGIGLAAIYLLPALSTQEFASVK